MLLKCSKTTCFLDEKREAADDEPLPPPPRVYVQNVPVYTGTMRTVSTSARGAGTHGDVLDGHTPHTTPQLHESCHPSTSQCLPGRETLVPDPPYLWVDQAQHLPLIPDVQVFAVCTV